MLLMLWVWQDQWRQMSVKSIPYSEFKEHLARGEVSECEIQDAEIMGKIDPKPAGAAGSGNRSQYRREPEFGGSAKQRPAVTSPHLPQPAKAGTPARLKPA